MLVVCVYFVLIQDESISMGVKNMASDRNMPSRLKETSLNRHFDDRYGHEYHIGGEHWWISMFRTMVGNTNSL